MFKRGLLFTVCAGLVGCGACLAIIGGIVFLVLGATQPVVDASDAFLEDVKAGNYAAAYDKCSDTLKNDPQISSAEGLQQFFEANGGTPTDWSFNSRNIVNNNRGEVSGSITFEGGAKRGISLVLFKEDGEWKIAGVNIEL